MTPEAKALRNAVVQTIRQRVRNPLYQLRMHLPNGQDTHRQQMMILGSVLLPEKLAPAATEEVPNPVAPPFYLDDSEVRALIAGQLAIQPRDFFHNANFGAWGAIIPTLGATGDTDGLGRRFYAVDQDAVLPGGGWGYNKIPWQSEKDAEGSTVPADAVVLPDFESIHLEYDQLLVAIGA